MSQTAPTPPTPQGKLTMLTVAMPADTNMNGDIFGGWLVSRMDMAAALAGRTRAQSRVVTVAIEKLVFIKPVYVGESVSCYATLISVGRTSMQIAIEVWTQSSVQDEEPKKVAEGNFSIVAIDSHGKPQLVDRQRHTSHDM